MSAARGLLSGRWAPPHRLSGPRARGGPGVRVCWCSATSVQSVPAPRRLESLPRTLAKGDTHDLTSLVAWLDQAGYHRVDAIEEVGDFAVRGGILDVFPPPGGTALQGRASAAAPGVPVRID